MSGYDYFSCDGNATEFVPTFVKCDWCDCHAEETEVTRMKESGMDICNNCLEAYNTNEEANK